MHIILLLLSNYFVINIQVSCSRAQSRHCSAQNIFLLIFTVDMSIYWYEAIKILISFYFASTFATRPYQALFFLTTTMGFYVETYLLGHIFPQMSHGCFQGYFSNHCIVLQHIGLRDEFVGIGVWTDIAKCRGFNFFGRSYVIFFLWQPVILQVP